MLEFLCDASAAPLITESFLKWVASGMGVAIVSLGIYIKALIAEKDKILSSQATEWPKMKESAENVIRERYGKIIEQKDKDILSLRDRVSELNTEKISFLQAQIDDAKKQEVGFKDLSEDYNELAHQLAYLIEQNVEVLEYYRQKREGGSSPKRRS